MKRSTIWILVITIPVILVLGFVLWASMTPSPMPEALSALETNAQVVVDSGEWFVFMPQDLKSSVGVIIYPGGKVDPRAYAPTAQGIAEAGFPVIIVPMPLNLAFFAPERATEVIAAFPEFRQWVLAGHSLGGAMAGRYALENSANLAGLAFWAAYPAESDNLADSGLEVVSIFGTLDGLATVAEVEASKPLLPPDTQWVAIEGGNHAQFGWYGDQSGDQQAAISRQDQQTQLIKAMLDLLQRIEG